MITISWDSIVPMLEHCQEKGIIINGTRYNDMLRNNLKPAIRTKRRGLLSKGVVLPHNNVCPDFAALIVEILQKLHFEILCPDLSPRIIFCLIHSKSYIVTMRRHIRDDLQKCSQFDSRHRSVHKLGLTRHSTSN